MKRSLLRPNRLYNPVKILFLLLLFIGFQLPSLAQFTGDFDEANWTFSTENTDGTIDLSGLPDEIIITGGNDAQSGDTDYTITIQEAGDIKFSWSYFSIDVDAAEYDPAGYVLNDVFTPVVNPTGPPDQMGSESITVAPGDIFAFRVRTEDGFFGPAIFTINNFSPFKNTAPTLDNIPDEFLGINPGMININLAGISAGISEAGQSITIMATSSDPAIIPDPSVTYSSPDATGMLSFTPVTDAFGEVTITVNVMDDGGTANGGSDNIDKAFKVNINSNFPPQIDPLFNVNLGINSPLQTVNMNNISAGLNSAESQIISISATSSNQAVINDADINVNYISPQTTGSLDFTPVAGGVGQTTITVTLMDNGGTANNGNDTFVETFVVKVSANHAPGINDLVDVFLQGNAPQQDIPLNGIEDGDVTDQVISVSAVSDNPTLIPDPTISYTSPDATGMLSFTPVADQFGTANIIVTVMDDGGTDGGGIDMKNITFQVQVSGNYPPTLNALQDIILPIDNGMQTINLAGITAGNGETQNLTVTVASNDETLIPIPTVNYTPNATTGSIDLTPAAGLSGSAMVTVTVMDDGGTANGGIDVFSRSFNVQVSGNLPPTIDMIPDLVINIDAPMQTVNFTGIAAGTGETQDITITATSDNTNLINNITVSYTMNDPGGSLTFIPESGQTGTANITVAVMDDGGTDNDGIDTFSRSFKVVVNQITTYMASTIGGGQFNRTLEGEPPVTTNGGNFNYHVQPFTVGITGSYDIYISSANFDPFVILYEENFNPAAPLQDVILGVDDDDISTNGILSGTRANLTAGLQYILVTTSSTAGSVGNFNMVIVGQSAASFGYLPTIDFIADVNMDEEGSATIDFTGISDGIGNVDNVTLTAASQIDAFPELNPVYNLDGTGSLQIDPAQDFNGIFEMTVTVATGTNVTFDQVFSVNVNPVNDPPVFAYDPVELVVNQDETGDVMAVVVPGLVPDDESDQMVIYDITPTTIDFATVAINVNTGELTFSDFNGVINSQEFTITADDQQSENNTSTQTFMLSINALPTDISLSDNVIDEDVPAGTVVGTFTTTDPDDMSGFTYSLVAGSGDTDNDKFVINNDELQTNTTFDVGSLTSYLIRIRVEDPHGAGFEKEFSIDVDDITGFENNMLASNTSIMPNPGLGEFYLTIESPGMNKFNISVVDITGRMIRNIQLTDFINKISTKLDLTDVRNGCYIVRIKSSDGRETSKRIIKN